MATVVNAMLGIWPFAAMNGVIAVIDVYWIWRLTRERHDADAYDVVEVGIDDAYLRHVLNLKAADVAATHPAFSVDDLAGARGEGSARGGGRTLCLPGASRG